MNKDNRRPWIIGAALVIATLTGATPSSHDVPDASAYAVDSIVWRVEAPFAPFGYLAKPQEAMREWGLRKTTVVGHTGLETFEEWYRRRAPKQTTSRFAEERLDSPYAEFLEPGPHQGPWVAAKGEYRKEYARPDSVAILARVPGATGSCDWSFEGSTQVVANSECGSYVRIVIPIGGADLIARSGPRSYASRGIVPEHLVIVGLGDSYSSGEGNPDRATRWKDGSPPKGSFEWLAPLGDKGSMIERGAGWWDEPCHRSFWNYQSFVALRLASEDEHRLVTLLQFACSGAGILDGLLARQQGPPGRQKRCERDGAPCGPNRSQLAMAVLALCPDAALPSRGDLQNRLIARAKVLRLPRALPRPGENFTPESIDVPTCGSEFSPPNLVLLSIGGNDAGFAGLVKWAIAPTHIEFPLADMMYGAWQGKTVVCPEAGEPNAQRRCDMSALDVHYRNELPDRYSLLGEAINDALRPQSGRVLSVSYPDPLRGDPKLGERYPGDPHGSTDPRNAWRGALLMLSEHVRNSKQGRTEFEFNFTSTNVGEVGVLSLSSLPRMDSVLTAAARASGFQPVPGTRKAFVGHGWLARPKRGPEDAPLSLPSEDVRAWMCGPENTRRGPSCWSAFQSSERYIRTFNDALLTQSGREEGREAGTMHPNAIGQAVMADSVFRAVSAVVRPR